MAKGGIKNGSGYSAGSAGTIFTKSVDDSVGTLTIDNDNIEPGNIGVTLISTPGPRSYKTAQVKNKGELTVTTGVSPLTCQNQFLAGNLSKITINANASISASPLQITTSTLQIPAGYQLNQKTLVTGATINCGDTLKLLNDTLSGTATVNGSFRNQGVLIPGIPTGTMTVNGKYVQKTDGVLIIDIGGKNPGVNFDLLSVSGQATLSGTLKINLINNFLPAIGDSFSILTCGSRIGQFVTVTGWDNYKVLYRSNRVTLLRIENINHPPVARAGMDRGYTAAYPVMLDGTGSYDPDTDPITFHWISPPGITLSDSTAVNPTFISPVTLTIQVLTFVLRVNDGFVNSAPDTVILTIYPPPLLTVQAQANPKVICPGGSSQLTAYPSGGFGNYTYLWSSQPAGFTSTQRTPVVAPAVNTMYTVQLSDGVSTTQASVTVTIQSNQPTGAISNLTPADSNFQVQPPLIFRWSKVLNASSYDFYLWKTTQSKPNIPTFAGMTDTMVYFPTYFNPYHIYKWQVVAKNFCNPDTTASPVHVCSFNFFSDLTVSNISHPDTVTAGTAAAVTFTVINSGIGGTGYGYWRDILYISDTPVFNSSSAIILGDWDNVSSLAAGAVYSRSVTVTMRSYFEGPYYLFLKTDYSEKVQETNEINNLVRSVGAIYIKQPPYPDLYVHDVQPLSVKVVPDSSFEVSWIVENIGNLAAVGGFSQKVTLVSGAKRTILGFKQDPEPLPVGTVLTQSAVFTVPKGLGFESDAKVEVQLIPYSWLVEKLNATANNVALSDQSIPVMKRMFINLTLPTIYENGTWPYQCILTRSGNTEADLTVNLVNSEPGRISVPLTATIPANQSEGYFWLSAINNSLVDGNTLVTVSAGALGYPGKSAQITVIDDEIPSVMLQLSKMQAMEGDTVRVKVSRDLVTGSPLMVHLTPGAYSQVTLPNTVTIPAGKDSVVLMMPVVNDNAPELTINVTITAWVYGYNSGVQTLTILDNDIPQIQFTISPRIASEGNGIYAAIATIKRIVPGNGTNTIRLIPSVAGQLILPAEISLPFNVMQKQFNVGIIDNNLVDGNRTVKVTASVYIPNCGCGAPVSSGGTITDSLTILDNDGPSVNISAIPGTVPEGLDTAGSLVVYRNTLGGPEITVDLSNNSPGELTIPSSVVIPAGLDSVSVPFASIDDTIQDGDQIALLTATASGYANGASFVIVTDRNMPDLVIQNFQTGLSTAAITKAVPVSLTLKNQGFAVAAYGVEIRYFLSRDNVLDERDLLISSQITSNAIPIGETLQIQDTLVTPGRIGNQFLIAIVNKNQEINELVYYNNTSNSLPITVIPDYNATVSVDGEIFDGNSPILISGSAITVDNQPAIQKPIDVYVVVNGVRRDIRTTTDTNGLITVQFQPLNGEAGNYYVGACFPEQRLNTPQDNFIVLGMKYIGEQIRWDTYLGESRQGTMAVKNFSSVDLTGVDISVVSGPPGCSLTFDPIGNLAGNDTVTVNYQLDATGLSAGTSYQMVKLKINCSEGADYDFIAWFYCVAPTGRITTSPGSLVSKMIKGQSTIKEFQIQNIGNGGTGTIRVTIPQVPWMTMVSTDTIASLAPYGTAIASIRLTPTDDLPLNVPV
jgi:hypothetical protein